SRSRDSGNLAGIVPLVTALPINGAAVAGPILGEMGQRTFEGKGNTARTSNVRSRITARVIQVFPNGDMRIEAIKLVKINKETEQLAVTGIVRRNDLANDNSIATTSVGDLRVEFNGKGIASADNAPGWLFRLFDKISPF
ncbi:MAG: flagellar basal body L-ring protein FlgH, partial [Pyrinomonadaceae bacterium]